jgi:hypothetical protein
MGPKRISFSQLSQWKMRANMLSGKPIFLRMVNKMFDFLVFFCVCIWCTGDEKQAGGLDYRHYLLAATHRDKVALIIDKIVVTTGAT